MGNVNSELLSQLRDIHAPAPPSSWPPGPLFWLLLTLALVAVAVGLWLLYRWRANAWRREALLELQTLADSGQQDARTLYAQCNLLLKRVCRQRYGSASAALIDEDWLNLLNQLYGDDSFSRDFGALCEAPYSTRLSAEAPKPKHLLEHCQQLISRAPAKIKAAVV